MTDEKELGAALAQTAITGAHIYEDYVEPGPNPGGSEVWKGVLESLKHQPALVRNQALGPFVVSTCQCPKCGELFVHYVEYKNNSHNNCYTACLDPDETPLCHRCTYATAWPTPSEQAIAAMVEIRWRYDEWLASCEVHAAKSQEQQRQAFLKAHDVFWRHGAKLLVELEHVFGDQVKAGVQAIAAGASGVVVEEG